MYRVTRNKIGALYIESAASTCSMLCTVYVCPSYALCSKSVSFFRNLCTSKLQQSTHYMCCFELTLKENVCKLQGRYGCIQNSGG